MYIGENSDLVSILLVSTIIIILVHNFPVLITLILIVKAELYKVPFKSWPESFLPLIMHWLALS